MRTAFVVGALALGCTLLADAPAQAQDGPTMWCYAEAGDGAEAAVRVYSAFFSAGAHEAIVKARAFKSAVAAEQISASSVTATCLPAPNYETAVAARNAEMKKAPGKVTAWEG